MPSELLSGPASVWRSHSGPSIFFARTSLVFMRLCLYSNDEHELYVTLLVESYRGRAVGSGRTTDGASE